MSHSWQIIQIQPEQSRRHIQNEFIIVIIIILNHFTPGQRQSWLVLEVTPGNSILVKLSFMCTCSVILHYSQVVKSNKDGVACSCHKKQKRKFFVHNLVRSCVYFFV